MTTTHSSKIQLGVSSCLVGEEVRFDGGHKRDPFVTGVLTKYFRFVPVCPEMAIGLGVPRQPVQLVGRPDDIRVIGARNKDLDVTDKLRAYGKRMAQELPAISGYIFKSRSPSCGMERVKLYPTRTGGTPSRDGVGQYAAAFMQESPLVPVEEEGRLNDPVLRENFLERVFTYRRWQDLERRGVTANRLLDFHTRHKFMLLAHSRKDYDELGRFLATLDKKKIEAMAEKYIRRLMRALQKRASRRSHANVLQHIQGYLKGHLDRDDKAELAAIIERYRTGQLPLIVPITLLNHHFRRHPEPYVTRQFYLNPHPPELMLRNLI